MKEPVKKVAGETVDKVSTEVEEPVKKVAGEVKKKFSGTVDERLAALRENKYYAKCLSEVASEDIEAFKKLKPEILEQIGDGSLVGYLGYGDVEGITTALNGLSPETLEALGKMDIGVDTLVGGFVRAGKKPTRDSILKMAESKAKSLDLPFNRDKILEKMSEELQNATQRHQSQFIRVKLLDEIFAFTPDNIEAMGDFEKNNLINWLSGGNLANEPFGGPQDKIFINNFFSLLKEDFRGDDGFDKIKTVADQLAGQLKV